MAGVVPQTIGPPSVSAEPKSGGPRKTQLLLSNYKILRLLTTRFYMKKITRQFPKWELLID
jgi:hypothetical protein